MCKEISLNEMQNIELNLLKKLKKICNDNKLRYFLFGGTLLGAIRHQGFIPWDDDIDVIMPRPDYIKLINLFDNNHDTSISLLSMYRDKNYYGLFAKLVDNRTTMDYFGVKKIDNLGVYIDIFPLDGMPEDEIETKWLIKRVNFYKQIIWGAIITSERRKPSKWYYKIPKEVINGCYRLIGYKFPLRRIEQLITKYDFDTSRSISSLVSSWSQKRNPKICKDAFDKNIKVQFCDDEFNAPVGYDEFLNMFYGDYLQLPPEDKRVTHHHCEVYWRNNY